MRKFKIIKVWKWIKHHRASLILSVLLVGLSAVVYKFQVDMFNRPNDTFFYLTQDLAFLPLDVLFVTLILERVLAWREKLDKRRIIHVVISALFSEMGNDLVRRLSSYNIDLSELRGRLEITTEWTLHEYDDLARFVKTRSYSMDSKIGDLNELKDFFMDKKTFLLTIFENNNLLEHATFTDSLWAVYHLLEELQSRSDFSDLPPEDYAHLSVDIKRAFQLLLIEWVYYMKRLKKQYPFLYSLALRKNPFFAEHVIIGRD